MDVSRETIDVTTRPKLVRLSQHTCTNTSPRTSSSEEPQLRTSVSPVQKTCHSFIIFRLSPVLRACTRASPAGFAGNCNWDELFSCIGAPETFLNHSPASLLLPSDSSLSRAIASLRSLSSSTTCHNSNASLSPATNAAGLLLLKKKYIYIYMILLLYDHYYYITIILLLILLLLLLLIYYYYY